MNKNNNNKTNKKELNLRAQAHILFPNGLLQSWAQGSMGQRDDDMQLKPL